MAEPVLTVVVPVRDAAPLLAGLLRALAAQEHAPALEVLVADDGSGDDAGGVVGAAAAGGLPVRRIVVAAPGAPGRGPGAARDAALAEARGRFLAFTDADCVPAPGWAAAIAAALDGGARLVQGPIVPPPGAAPSPFDRTVQRPVPSPLFETANLAARRDDVRRAGGFGRGLRGRGKELGEDLALGWALVRAGTGVTWAPDAVVEHPVEPRGWAGAAGEHRRDGAFCTLVAAHPELRDVLLHRGRFLGTHRPAALGAQACAVVAASSLRASGPRSAAVRLGVAAGLATPYLRGLARRSRTGAGRAARARVAAGLAAGDLVATASLAAGSVRSRTVVL